MDCDFCFMHLTIYYISAELAALDLQQKQDSPHKLLDCLSQGCVINFQSKGHGATAPPSAHVT